MKFLLVAVNAKYIHTNPAVYSIKSFIEAGFLEHEADGNSCQSIQNQIEIAEYTINNSPSDILADIYKQKPDIIAFSCYIWNWEIVKRLLVELPKIMPDIPIWLGGPEVSYDGIKIMEQYPAVTGIVVGEGEQTCKEVFEYYSYLHSTSESKNNISCTELSQILGIIYRTHSGNIITTPTREPMNIDDLSFSYTNLSGDDIKNRIIYYESSRGCPYSCSYCLSATDKTIRYKSFKKVKEELTIILAHEVAQIKFVDRTFNANREHAIKIWQFIQENYKGITNFHFEIAADLLTDEDVELLRTLRPGLIQLEIGVQSTHQKTLESINRKMDFSRVNKTVTTLRINRNIHIHLDLIAGLPYEDYESFANSFNEVYALKPDKLQLGFLKVLPGTPIRRDADELGIIYEDTPPYQVLFTKWLMFDNMQYLHRIEEMVNTFYNTNQFTNTITVLELAFKNPFQMYEKLADFFTEKDYFRKTPARIFRYQSLLDFAIKYDPDNESCYRELLTHDMYLREKTKTRPPFAHDLSPYRKQINSFYADETKERIRMTTIEVYYYDINAKKPEDKLKRTNTPNFIYYDYQTRNPLTHNASTNKVNMPIPKADP